MYENTRSAMLRFQCASSIPRQAVRKTGLYGAGICFLKLSMHPLLIIPIGRLRPLLAALAFASGAAHAETTLLNVSYDVTRELFKEVNPAFSAKWKAETGETVSINQSHGGSSKQVRAVLDGLEADVVTMNQSTDIDVLAAAGLVDKQWESRFPENAAPFTSTIVFVVRKGNPKKIKEWVDLVREGMQVIIPNPKTSGNGRYSYLAAWGVARKAAGGSDAVAKDFVTKLFKNVPVLDSGGRGATTTFAQRGIGDVLLTFENEAVLTQKELGGGGLQIVYPSSSILAEAPIAVVDKVVDKRGTRKQAEAYLRFLYSPAGQELAAKHSLRPRSPEVLAKHAAAFPQLNLLSIADAAGGWSQAQKTHFNDGGIFDQIYLK
ncbi:MAG: periplasmic thiosulfate-binding protein [Chthoniobacteraceae bacterium]|nr:periplasmic thiosulfate-binding protein [Chthoniobacteraceae bacterium]